MSTPVKTSPPDHRLHRFGRDRATTVVRDWGPETAPVVIHHHGTPSCSLAVPGGWAAPAELGVRVITFDRAGYGGSANQPGRTVADAARTTAMIADELGIDRFAVMGTSGGGPHAAATAAVLGERVTRLCVSVGLGPVELAGFEVAEGMLPETVAEIVAARNGPASLRQFIESEMAADVPMEIWFNKLPAPDVEILGRAEVRVEEQAEDADMMRNGIEGWLEDELAMLTRPWDCDLGAVTARTLFVYGGADVLVPHTHGDAYVRAIGHGQLLKVPGVGHWMRDVEPSILRWLVAKDELPARLEL